MFHQVDLIATLCYDWLTFDGYLLLTTAKMFGFFQYYPTYPSKICTEAISTLVFKASRP